MSAERRSSGQTGGAPVYAVVGSTAGTVAYNLAGMMARTTEGEGKLVLLVDAEGHVSREILRGVAREPAGELISGGELDVCLAGDKGLGLKALLYPERDSLAAEGFIGRLRREFDALVVACGPSRYATDWLLAADGVVASGASTRELDRALRHAEELRDQNGALLAPMGRLKLSPYLEDRRTFRLPSAKSVAYGEAESAGEFATLIDEDVARAFEPLLEELLNTARESYPSVHKSSFWSGENFETPSEEPTEGSLEGPSATSSEIRDTKRLSADEIVERMRRGAYRPGDAEQGDDGAEEVGRTLRRAPGEAKAKFEGLKAEMLALAGRLRRRRGGSPGGAGEARAQGSAEELERRLKLSLRETVLGGISRVCVGSPKGGVGKSSIAYSLAGSIAYYTNMRVCLVDADPNFGSTRLLVPRPSAHSVVTLAEAAEDVGSLSDLRGFVAQDEKMRLDVVLCPKQAHEITRLADLGEAYGRIDSVLSRFYDLVVYDLGLGFRDPAIRRVLSLSDELLFVTDSEVIPNAMLTDAIKYVENLGVELSRTTLVLNHRLPTADESALTPQVRAAHASLLRRVTEIPYDARMSQILNRRSFHIEELTPRTRLGMLTTVAACLEGLKDAGRPADKVVAQVKPDGERTD